MTVNTRSLSTFRQISSATGRPDTTRLAMQASPSTPFVSFAQAILYRGTGLDVVWPQFLATAGIGALFVALSLIRFRSALSSASS